MTLQEIAAEIDILIERYSRVRTILATLVEDSVDPIKTTLETKEGARHELFPFPAAPEEVVVTVLPARVPRQRHRFTPVRRPEQTALSGLVPQEVIVISPAEILQRTAEREKTSVALARPLPSSGHTLDDLVSALRSRGLGEMQLH